MQKIILKSKNRIMVVCGLLLAIGFMGEFVLHVDVLAVIALGTASVLGALPIAIQAYQALKVKVVSIDVLVTIAVLGAFAIKNLEESAVVTFLFLFGAYLEQRTLNKTRSAIKELTEMAPESALRQQADGSYLEVDVEEVNVQDILLVKTGAKVPVDGTVLSGEGYINEASITGEPLPAEKRLGEKVFAGTILENGTLQIVADRVGEDTTFGRIIELVEEAQDTKSEAERFIDSFSKYYTPLVLLLAAIVYVLTRNMELSITILVLGCPGALVIGVPVSNVAGIGNGAKNGILLKGSEVIQNFSKVDVMVFDKTGTLTMGNPKVKEYAFFGEEKEEVLRYLSSVERESDHPLAKAVVEYIGDSAHYEVEDTKVMKGGGISARVQGRNLLVGNRYLMEENQVQFPQESIEILREYEKRGDSLVLTSVDGTVRAVIGIRDQVRPGVKEDLLKLRNLGVKELVLLSGDNQGTVDTVAKELGLTKAFGHMLPEDKSAYIRKLQEEGNVVAFVGDGVNDSPSLALAEIGIAMGSGTDVAIETSDVVLMNGDFGKLPHALGLAKATARNMRQNIIIAVGVVLILILSLFFSEWMNMSIGMLVHEASILLVIINGMRLLKFSGYSQKNHPKQLKQEKISTALDQHQVQGS